MQHTEHKDLAERIDTLAATLVYEKVDADIRLRERLAPHTTFRIGGPADIWIEPRSVESLTGTLRLLRTAGVPVSLIGGGANLLVADKGVRGAVVSLLGLRQTLRKQRDILYASAGISPDQLCLWAADCSLGGLDFLSGLPGSVGGAVYMNARCYDREIADCALSVDYLLPDSADIANMEVVAEEWEYKRTPFMPGGRLAGCVIIGANFRTTPADPARLRARMAELQADRKNKGHYTWPSAGSMFKNNREFGRPSGKILDELGFRGKRIGDAMVSPLHANIFVNAGQASARDMLSLIGEAQEAVRATFGFELEPEVQCLGDFSP